MIENLTIEKKVFYICIIFGMFLRLTTFFFILDIDIVFHTEMSRFLADGKNPYTSDLEYYYKYPPLSYYLYSIFGILTNFSYSGPKLLLFTADIINIYLIYKIGLTIKNAKLGAISALNYTLNPLVLAQFFHDVNEIASLTFTLLAIYFLLINRRILSAVSLTLGIGFKLYPLFFLIPITLYIYKNITEKKVFNVFKYYIIIFAVFLLICLPFLILSPQIFIERLFLHSSRRNLGFNIIYHLENLEFLYNSAFTIFNINFSYQFLIQVVILGVIFLFFFFSSKDFNIKDLFIVMVLISFVLPLINFQIQFKYTYLIAFPFMIYIINQKSKNISEIEFYYLFLINFFAIVIFLLIIILQNDSFDLLISPEYSYIIQKESIFMSIFLISFLIFLIYEERRKDGGDPLLHLTATLPFIIYSIYYNSSGAIIAYLFCLLNVLYFIFRYQIKSKTIFIAKDDGL